MARILIVEDEPGIAELVLLNLRHHGFLTAWVADAESAQREVEAAPPDLVVLDWILPDASGVELVRRWRASLGARPIPVLMLTARATDADKVAALEAGADDYVTKPFSMNELLARIRALLRRREGAEDILCIDALQLDPATHRVRWKGRTLRVGPAEFRLLRFLMQHPERVHSRGDLLGRVWGAALQLDQRTIDVHIKRLRDALGPAARCLVETVRGAGYRITAHPMSTAPRVGGSGDSRNVDLDC